MNTETVCQSFFQGSSIVMRNENKSRQKTDEQPVYDPSKKNTEQSTADNITGIVNPEIYPGIAYKHSPAEYDYIKPVIAEYQRKEFGNPEAVGSMG
jgi:hypothetical protein